MHSLLDHLKLLIIGGNLMLGAAMVVYLHQTRHRYRLAPLRPIGVHLVLYNLAVLALFVYKYYELNVEGSALVFSPAPRHVVLLMIAYGFFMGFSYASLAIYLAFTEQQVSRRLRRWVILASVLLLAGIPLWLLFPQGSVGRLVHYHFYENFGVIFLVLELGLMIALPIRAGRLQDPERVRVIRAFSFLYISRYPVIAGLTLLPQPFRLMLALAYPNVVPYLWLRFFMLPHDERVVSREAMKADVERIEGHYGLSPREREILGLILAGKSNRDMEESLFISYHTVKNHVSNIYRKLGVKTRFELLHLVAKSDPGKRVG